MSHHPEPTARPNLDRPARHEPSPLDRATSELTGHMARFLDIDGKRDIPRIRSAAADTIFQACDRQEIACLIADVSNYGAPFGDVWDGLPTANQDTLLKIADAIINKLTGGQQ